MACQEFCALECPYFLPLQTCVEDRRELIGKRYFDGGLTGPEIAELTFIEWCIDEIEARVYRFDHLEELLSVLENFDQKLRIFNEGVE